MINAQHNAIIDPFFRWYVIWKMKRSFSSFSIEGNVKNNSDALLLVCNHISWWDGMWALYLNQQLFRRKFYFMMLEEQLSKNWFFKYTGGFPVRKSSSSLIESLNYASKLLQNPDNLVLIFPQGKLQSMHRNTFVFEKGIERILEANPGNTQVVFQANLVDYLSEVKPAVHIYITAYNGSGNIRELETAYNNFHRECLEKQAKKES